MNTFCSISRLAVRPLLCFALILPLAGCMLTHPRSGRVFRYVEDNFAPQDEAFPYLWLPVLIPLGTAAALTDATVVHPIEAAGDSASETRDTLWSNMRWDDEYLSEALLLPWRAAGSVILFPVDLAFRILFEVPETVEDVHRIRDAAPPASGPITPRTGGEL